MRQLHLTSYLSLLDSKPCVAIDNRLNYQICTSEVADIGNERNKPVPTWCKQINIIRS